MTTVFTGVCAPDLRLQEVVIPCLRATAEVFSDSQKIAGVEMATDAVWALLKSAGWRALLPLKPAPNYSSLMRRAVEIADGPLFWTVEHDTVISSVTRLGIEAMMAAHPEAAAIEARSVDECGRTTRPCVDRVFHSTENPGLLEAVHGTSFNCVCWRRQALIEVDWSGVMEWGKSDTQVCLQLLPRWKFYVATALTTWHRRANCGPAARAVRDGRRRIGA